MRMLAGSLLLLPFAVGAETVYVEYEGTVSGIYENNELCRVQSSLGFTVGDPVKGVLKIDTDLPIPDSDPFDPSRSLYGATTFGPTVVDFITGYTTPAGMSKDNALVLDNAQGFGDVYNVNDVEGQFTANEHSLFLEVTKSAGDLISSDSLVQSFTAVPAEDGSTLIGRVTGRIVNDLRTSLREVVFALTRISVTPGRCSI
jgi:hypothetical protein